jgi:hypothetical protein
MVPCFSHADAKRRICLFQSIVLLEIDFDEVEINVSLAEIALNL